MKKVMRKALLAAGMVAALTGAVNAQTISPIDTEISFIGQVDVTSFVTQPGGTPGGPFNPREDLPTTLSAFGFIEGGALFQGEDLFTTVGVGGVRDARFTFAATGLTLNPATLEVTGTPSSTIVTARFENGVYEVFFDADGGAGDPGGQDFDTQGDFSNGTRILSGNFSVESVFVIPNNTTRPAFGSLEGNIVFNPALGSGPINAFLAANPGFAAGFFTNTGISTAGRVGFGEFSTTGQIELIPEPGTIALLGAGLLPMGMFLRRRRA